MPCRDPDDDVLARSDKLDKVTRLLCSTLKALDPRIVKGLHPETQVWWEEHQKADREREAREKAARARQRKEDEALFEKLKRKLGK